MSDVVTRSGYPETAGMPSDNLLLFCPFMVKDRLEALKRLTDVSAGII